ADGLFVHPRSQPAAGGTERDRINPVTAQNSQMLIAGKRTDFLSRRGVPKCNRVGGILHGQPVSVATEGQRLNFFDLAGDGAGLLARGHIPELDGLVPASRGQPLPIGTECNGSDPAGVTLESVIQHELGNGWSGEARNYCSDPQVWSLRRFSQNWQFERFKFSRDSGSLPRRQI